MPSAGPGADPDRTRRQLLDAAIAPSTAEGLRGATARAVAAAAGCNQASIYYHFGGMAELLVAALLDSNERRFAAYREVLEPSTTPPGSSPPGGRSTTRTCAPATSGP